jgi:hypothetical protein
VVDEHDDLAAQFGALDGGQVAEGSDQVVGQFHRNVRLFHLVMHSFSPLRFDLAKTNGVCGVGNVTVTRRSINRTP